MSKTLAFEISDDLYEAFEQVALKTGRSVDSVALEYLARKTSKHKLPQSPEEIEADKEKIRRHFGAVSLGYPTGADNESIDADLVSEYGNTHEEEF
jgi:hypothetical protein